MPQSNSYPQGEYEAEVLSHVFQVSTNDNLMLVVKIRPLTFKAEEAPDYGARRIRLMFHYEQAVEESAEKLRRFFGWEGTRLSELQSSALVGMKIPVVALAPRNGYDNFVLPKLHDNESQNLADKQQLQELDAAYNAILQRKTPGYSAPKKSAEELLDKLDAQETEDNPF